MKTELEKELDELFARMDKLKNELDKERDLKGETISFQLKMMQFSSMLAYSQALALRVGLDSKASKEEKNKNNEMIFKKLKMMQ